MRRYDSAPPLSSLSRQQLVSLSQSSCVSPVGLTKGRRGGGGGRGACFLYKSFNTLWSHLYVQQMRSFCKMSYRRKSFCKKICNPKNGKLRKWQNFTVRSAKFSPSLSQSIFTYTTWKNIIIWARIFKLLRSPRIGFRESIPPAYAAWRAGTIT